MPGLGGLLDAASSVGRRLVAGRVPGQVALFASSPLGARTLIAGSSTVRLTVSSVDATDATLFVSLHDVASDGTDTLPANLVSPVRITGLTPGAPTTITVALPGIVREVASGHRLVVEVSTTDLAYALPGDARSYTVALAAPDVTVPVEGGHIVRTGHPLVWLLVGIGVTLLVALGVDGDHGCGAGRGGPSIRRWSTCPWPSRGWSRSTATATARSTASHSASSAARWSACSAPTAPARPPRCAC